MTGEVDVLRPVRLARRLEPRTVRRQAAARAVHRRRRPRAVGVRDLSHGAHARSRAGVRGHRAARTVPRRALRGLHGRSRRARARAARGRRHAIDWTRPRHDGARDRMPNRSRPGAIASSSCTPTTASCRRCSPRAASTASTARLRISGVSSMQFDAPGRGFSFRRDEPLDMRMDQTHGADRRRSAAGVDEVDLANVIFRYGEERFSRRIARGIVEARRAGPIATTGQLAQIVRAGDSRAKATSGSIRRRARFRRCGSG